MGLFNFNITDTWQIAYQHGHSSFKLLKVVQDIELEYSINLTKLNSLELSNPNYIKLISQNDILTKEMFKSSSASIMLFQGMMEAIINDSLEKEKKLNHINKSDSFRNKWINSLNELEQETNSFDFYEINIYKKYRNKLVHPKSIELDDFNDISIKNILTGFKNGWTAYKNLYMGLEHPHTENSWETILNLYGINDI